MCVPRQITDKKAALQKLAALFPEKKRLFERRLNSKSAFLFLERKLPPD